jgi:Tol biopolymer transport system component
VPTVAGSANVSGAPTAVPIPSIVIPTSIPASQASNNSAATPVSVPTASSAPAPMVTAAPASGAPAPSIQDLKGKILFFSDRGGGYSQLYVMNADGSNQQLCNCSDLLQTIVNNETVSPDKQQFLFIKTVGSARGGDIQIWRHNNANNTDEPLTGGAPGFPGVDYDPVWSPDSKHIAWVTEVNHYDEIYLYDASQNSNVRLTQSSGEWYKHPSFSPDGSHITYWTNLGNLTYKQIWQMNLDGSGQTNLSSNSYNDWDPIWVK